MNVRLDGAEAGFLSEEIARERKIVGRGVEVASALCDLMPVEAEHHFVIGCDRLA